MIISAASQQTFCSAGENQDLFPGSSQARNSTGRNISGGRYLALELRRKYLSHFNDENIFVLNLENIWLFWLSVQTWVTWLTSGLWSLCVSLHGNRSGGTSSSDLPAIKPTSRISRLYLISRWVFLRDLPCPALSSSDIEMSFDHFCTHQAWLGRLAGELRALTSPLVSCEFSIRLLMIQLNISGRRQQGTPVTTRPVRNGWSCYSRFLQTENRFPWWVFQWRVGESSTTGRYICFVVQYWLVINKTRRPHTTHMALYSTRT